VITLKIEVIHSSEMLVNTFQVTWYHNSEYCNLKERTIRNEDSGEEIALQNLLTELEEK
jgi:hypothetical protein